MIAHTYKIKNAICRKDIIVNIYKDGYICDWLGQTYMPESTMYTEIVMDLLTPSAQDISIIRHEMMHVLIFTHSGTGDNRVSPKALEEDACDAIGIFFDDYCRLVKLIMKKNKEIMK